MSLRTWWIKCRERRHARSLEREEKDRLYFLERTKQNQILKGLEASASVERRPVFSWHDEAVRTVWNYGGYDVIRAYHASYKYPGHDGIGYGQGAVGSWFEANYLRVPQKISNLHLFSDNLHSVFAFRDEAAADEFEFKLLTSDLKEFIGMPAHVPSYFANRVR